MGISRRHATNFAFAFSLLVLGACGGAQKAQLDIRVARQTAGRGLSQEGGQDIVLSPDLCYALHVTGDDPNLSRGNFSGRSCKNFPARLGLVKGLLSKGEYVELEVVAGPARRFDLLGISKADVPNGDCRAALSVEQDSAGNPRILANQTLLASNKIRLIATRTLEVTPGAQTLTLYAINPDEGGAAYTCSDAPNTTVPAPTPTDSVSSPLDPSVPKLSTSPTILDFGTVQVGSAQTARTFVFTNSSSENLTGLNVNLPVSLLKFNGMSSTFPGDGGTCSTILAAGSSCQISVTFAGTIAGSLAAPIAISYTTSAGLEQVSVPVTATVNPGAATTGCVLMSNETLTPGNGCPNSVMQLQSNVPVSLTYFSTDSYGNPVPTTGSVTVHSSEPGTTDFTISVSAGTGTVPFTPNVPSAVSTSWNLQVGNAIRAYFVNDVCAGTPVSSPFQAGDGSAALPFLICTSQQLIAIGTNATNLTKTYKLMADVNLAGVSGLPIGGTQAFTGYFDGNGHKISNFSLSQPSSSAGTGLFAEVKGFVRNFSLSVASGGIFGETFVGAVTGKVTGGGLLENISVDLANGFVSANTGTVGGITGAVMDTSSDSVVKNCHVFLGSSPTTPRVKGGGNVGGVVGSLENHGIVKDSSVGGQGRIQLESGPSTSVGGLIGRTIGTASLETSKVGSGVNVTSNISPPGSVHAGGAVGDVEGGDISYVYSEGTIGSVNTNSTDYFGGLVGYRNAGQIYSSYFNGSFDGSISNTGGIVGWNVYPTTTNLCASTRPCGYPAGLSSVAGGSVNGTDYSVSISAGNFSSLSSLQSALGSTEFTYSGGHWMMIDSVTAPRLRWENVAGLSSTFRPASSFVTSNDGLMAEFGSISGRSRSSLCKSAGRWYWEVEILSGDYEQEIGIISSSDTSPGVGLWSSSNAYSVSDVAGGLVAYNGGVIGSSPGYQIGFFGTTQQADYHPGQIVGVALDLDSATKTLTFYLNGVQLTRRDDTNASYTITNINSGTYCAAIGRTSGNATPSYLNSVKLNFGAQPLQHTPPSGYLPYNFMQ